MTSPLFNFVRLKIGIVLCFVQFTKENLFVNQDEWSLSCWRTQKVIYNSRHKAPILDNHIKKASIEYHFKQTLDFFVCLFRLELILTQKEAINCVLSQKVYIVALKTWQILTVVYEATN